MCDITWTTTQSISHTWGVGNDMKAVTSLVYIHALPSSEHPTSEIPIIEIEKIQKYVCHIVFIYMIHFSRTNYFQLIIHLYSD